MKPEKAISLLQRGIVGEIYDEKGYLTALGYEALDAIDRSKCPTLVQRPHGEWIRNDNGTYSCSVCQSWIPEEQHYYARYCLHCGRIMKEKGGE